MNVDQHKLADITARSFRRLPEDDILPNARMLVSASLEGAGYELIRLGRSDEGQALLFLVPELGRRFQGLIERLAAEEP